MSPTLALTKALIERASVTPSDGGCHALLAERLEAMGFVVESLPFGDVQNFWARLGTQGPLFAFAGHTDVVPPGPVNIGTVTLLRRRFGMAFFTDVARRT